MTRAEDAEVQRSGSFRFHGLSVIVWTTVMFLAFPVPRHGGKIFLPYSGLGILSAYRHRLLSKDRLSKLELKMFHKCILSVLN